MRKLVYLMALTAAACTPPPPQNATAEDIAAQLEASADNLEAAAAAASSEAGSQKLGASGWSYREEKDEMRGSTSRWASVSATREINLGFPYGASTPELTVRYMKQHGTDVMITINGQITCNSFSNDTVAVKFDNGGIEKWTCNGTSDGTADTAFISPSKRFIAKLKSAKKVTIEAPVYQAGNVQMTFAVAGLKWD